MDWVPSIYINGLVCLGERQNLVSARVPSGSAQALNPIPIPPMPEAARSIVIGSREQLMLKMVHDSVAKGVTRVVRLANVLRCGQQMEKLPH